ncbi:hypothetical protein EVB81_041 [Rhizobium phage RHph_I46]|uniref:Uncharacterized protein n=1 Tax=Rhizobium phage RHph_I1_9 TaxID=2509729 RepID=A0A7S5R9H3_9CAUD|nr:hypothetical protein PP936_gp040 [Rhizobium phage RHph_I1_9]QIG69610.1 hypothetical protein EVB81_041 [Rhizobium phage RHph_I46]QIG70891.1 hypothetical protein EVB92_041 [Rhizobium phage RHph_I9]QIG73477.1 hypothetical protein EVC04_040 [Rhizobium phage RHph_I1_9]QIG76230.1 hypothetical protein EVC25_041 [Rhizobium phage RHph_I34]
MIVKVTEIVDPECHFLTRGKKYEAYDVFRWDGEIVSYNILDDDGDELYCWMKSPRPWAKFQIMPTLM